MSDTQTPQAADLNQQVTSKKPKNPKQVAAGKAACTAAKTKQGLKHNKKLWLKPVS